MGERREGDSMAAVDGVVDPLRRCRDENGYSLVAEGTRKVSLCLRPVGVMGVERDNSVSDSLSSRVLSDTELVRVSPSSASELVDLRGLRSIPHFFSTGSRYFFR